MTAPISRKQLAYLHVLLSRLHVTDRDRKLTIVTAIVYRPITSTNDLTADEAKVTIDMLDTISQCPDPAAELELLITHAERVLS